MNGNETITIKRGYSEDGGFHYAAMTSTELTERELNVLGGELRYVGLRQIIGGYEIVHESVMRKLGETFTVDQMRTLVAEVEQEHLREDEMRRKGMVKCDCGHTVHKSQRMMTSTGSSCHECYDRMSK